MVGQEEGQREEEEDSYFLRINATATKQTITDVPCGCSYSSLNLFKCITFVIKSPLPPPPPQGQIQGQIQGQHIRRTADMLEEPQLFFRL